MVSASFLVLPLVLAPTGIEEFEALASVSFVSFETDPG